MTDADGSAIVTALSFGRLVGGRLCDAGMADLLWLTPIVACGVLAIGVLAVEGRVGPGVDAGTMSEAAD